jgi:hypothetical protein
MNLVRAVASSLLFHGTSPLPLAEVRGGNAVSCPSGKSCGELHVRADFLAYP